MTRIIWTKDRILKKLALISQQLEHFPTTNWLQKNGYSRMVYSIYVKFNGIEVFAKELNLDSQNHKKGYWANWKNVEIEFQKVMEQTLIFPNYNQVKQLNPKLRMGIKNF